MVLVQTIAGAVFALELLKRSWKLLLFSYLLIWFIGSLWMMAVVGSMVPDGLFLGIDLKIYKDYVCIGFAGAVGGTLYALRMFHEYYEQLTSRWLYWYFMRPFLCFGSAMITIILFESGIMLLQVSDSMHARIGIAFLSGFGYGKFIEKIRSLTYTFFNGNSKQSQPQPPIESDKKPQSMD
jgi:hypothetical protein